MVRRQATESDTRDRAMESRRRRAIDTDACRAAVEVSASQDLSAGERAGRGTAQGKPAGRRDHCFRAPVDRTAQQIRDAPAYVPQDETARQTASRRAVRR